MRPLWLNAVLYQLTWCASVFGAARGLWWSGLVVLLGFAAWQLADARSRATDLRLVAACLACGALLDGALAATGLAHYALAPAGLPLAPLWIFVLWAAFALTLNHSLAVLQRHRALAAALGAVGAPLAYLGAARAEAVSFAAPLWAALALGLAWALVLPLLLALARRWTAQARA